LSGIGVQCGAHRLWSHKAFKAKLGLRIFLAACQTMAGQKNIYYWVRDHRVHHKYSDTDADPHNSHRGFWFAHMGWIYLKKHPLVLEKGNQLDMSDIEADPVVMFQQKYYVPLLILFWGVIPAVIPVIFWNESLLLSILGCVFFRHVYMLNVTGLVNSYAHMFGYRPYDTRIRPAESTYVRHLMMGEGFHNYHHTFPWDYSASELGSLDVFNPATAAIDFFHAMGWAYDLRKPTPAMVANRIKGHGDQVEAELHRTSS
ncbi:PREDICTED: stearoyl-CoA desaturase 5-like, partial [Rhagoletis zephyria]|uniref:stearoyl-CoA desaturase 5-like n=1 Tax=Rhagoletis zephyria TaxID=28612 RepID=UPI00081139BA